MNLRPLTDEQLLSDTKRLAINEREILIQVLHHLLEVNRRKLFSPRFRSLFEYATVELGYSADQASRRLSAMKLLKEIPEIEAKVASAELNLTTMGLAQTHFRNETSTREEKLEVLKAIEGKSTRETTRELIKRSSQPERLKSETVRPVSSTVNEVRLFLKDEVIEKISRLKRRFAHKHPHLSNSELFEILLDRAIAETDPGKEPKRASTKTAKHAKDTQDGEMSHTDEYSQQSGLGDKSAAPRKRFPGAALKRHVFREAQGRCVKCGSIHALEFDHKTPFAIGGLTIAENLRLLCRNCNQRENVKIFG